MSMVDKASDYFSQQCYLITCLSSRSISLHTILMPLLLRLIIFKRSEYFGVLKLKTVFFYFLFSSIPILQVTLAALVVNIATV